MQVQNDENVKFVVAEPTEPVTNVITIVARSHSNQCSRCSIVARPRTEEAANAVPSGVPSSEREESKLDATGTDRGKARTLHHPKAPII